MNIVGWVIWVTLILYIIAAIVWVRRTFRIGEPIMPGTVSMVPSLTLVAIWSAASDVNKLHILWIAPTCALLIMFIVQVLGWGRTLVNLIFSFLTIGVIPLPDQITAECPYCKTGGTLRQHSFDSFDNAQRCREDEHEGKEAVLHLTCFNCGGNFTHTPE